MNAMRPGDRLARTIRLVLPSVHGLFEQFWQHDRLGALFPEYLFVLHAAMRASVPLMEAARDAAGRLAPGDAVSRQLVQYFDRHIPEERDHDRWLLEDMHAIGIDPQDVVARVGPPAIAALIGAQYYWIRHDHPLALLGYIAVVEGHPPRADDLRRAQRRAGLPLAAFRTLLEHADVDGMHADDVTNVLNAMALTDRQSALLGISAMHSAEYVGAALCHVLSSDHRLPT